MTHNLWRIVDESYTWLISPIFIEKFKNETNTFAHYVDNFSELGAPKEESLFQLRKTICQTIGDGNYDVIKDDETVNVFITTTDKNPKAHKNIADNIRLHKERIANEPKNENKTISGYES